MPVTPPPPTTLAGLLPAYVEVVDRIIALVGGLDETVLTHPSPCPGWTVFDQVAHVESVEAMFQGEQIPEADVTAYGHVRSPFAAVVERTLESRRGRPVERVLRDLAVRRDRRVGDLTAPGVTDETLVQGPFGMARAADVLGIRIFDIWLHEQDIREAVGVPGGLDGVAAAVTVDGMLRGLPRSLARGGAVRAGETVRIEVVGPVAAVVTVRGVEAADGRVRGEVVDGPEGAPVGAPGAAGTAGEPGAAGEAGAPGEPGGLSEPVCVLVLGTREMTRLCAGREPMGEGFGWSGYGDSDRLAAVVKSLAVTP